MTRRIGIAPTVSDKSAPGLGSFFHSLEMQAGLSLIPVPACSSFSCFSCPAFIRGFWSKNARSDRDSTICLFHPPASRGKIRAEFPGIKNCNSLTFALFSDKLPKIPMIDVDFPSFRYITTCTSPPLLQDDSSYPPRSRRPGLRSMLPSFQRSPALTAESYARISMCRSTLQSPGRRH